jgi:hypothetical protein
MVGSRPRGEVAVGYVGRGLRAAVLAILRPVLSQHRGTIPNARRMQLPPGGPGGGGLGGMLLGLAQLGDRYGQGRQVGDQRGRDQRVVAGDLAGQCH